MKFELTQIDPYNCSIEELQKEINRLDSISNDYHGIEQSIKIWINSIYGALGSRFFPYYNVACAEAITLQGQDVIKFTNHIIEDYVFNIWHLDKELHEKLGITYVNKINPTTKICIYNDTDSSYITLAPLIASCDTKDNGVDFILKLKKYRLEEYINKKFDEYGKKYNTQNIQVLELEKISYSAMLIAKKKYILDLAWKEPGIRFKPQEKIKYVGIEIVQGSTGKFTRKVLKEMITLIFNKKKALSYSELIKKLKDYKAQFCLQDPEDISKQQTIGDYEKYVLEDRKNVILAPKCPINVRSAAI